MAKLSATQRKRRITHITQKNSNTLLKDVRQTKELFRQQAIRLEKAARDGKIRSAEGLTKIESMLSNLDNKLDGINVRKSNNYTDSERRAIERAADTLNKFNAKEAEHGTSMKAAKKKEWRTKLEPLDLGDMGDDSYNAETGQHVSLNNNIKFATEFNREERAAIWDYVGSYGSDPNYDEKLTKTHDMMRNVGDYDIDWGRSQGGKLYVKEMKLKKDTGTETQNRINEINTKNVLDWLDTL